MKLVIDRWDMLQEAARVVRDEVFVIDQRIPLELEWDEMDVRSWHAVLFDEAGIPQATGRLLPGGHIGRMAVRAAQRSAGLGARVLAALTGKAQELGYCEVMLNAQLGAEGFYARYGFRREGAVFVEAGIDHVTMRKRLDSAELCRT